MTLHKPRELNFKAFMYVYTTVIAKVRTSACALGGSVAWIQAKSTGNKKTKKRDDISVSALKQSAINKHLRCICDDITPRYLTKLSEEGSRCLVSGYATVPTSSDRRLPDVCLTHSTIDTLLDTLLGFCCACQLVTVPLCAMITHKPSLCTLSHKNAALRALKKSSSAEKLQYASAVEELGSFPGQKYGK